MADKVQLRLDSALAARLRAEAAKIGWTESQLVRYILEVSLGDEPRMSALTQIAWGLNAKLQAKMPAVVEALRDDLERILIE